MKIMILGGDGMLGHKMLQVLSANERFDVACTVRENEESFHKSIPLFDGMVYFNRDFDLFMRGCLTDVSAFNPDVVINCAGIIKQRKWISEDPLKCLKVNSLLPLEMERMSNEQKNKFRLIHFSSDCVFDGSKGNYVEEDERNAFSVYGRTKILGEVSGENSLTLRTSFIGRELRNNLSLLEWFISQKNSDINGFTKAMFSGVTSEFLCNLVEKIILDHKDLSGIYHVTAETINKYDLLCLLKEKYGFENMKINPDDRYDRDVICNRSMKSDKLIKAIGYAPPKWSDLAESLAQDTTPYEEWKRRIR